MSNLVALAVGLGGPAVAAGVIALARLGRHREKPPAARRPGGPHDGAPLTFDEQRALSDVETDSWITIPEPVYGPAAEQGSS